MPASTRTFSDGAGNRVTITCSGSQGTGSAAPAALWQVDGAKSNTYAGNDIRVYFKLILGLSSSEVRVRCENSVLTQK